MFYNLLFPLAQMHMAFNVFKYITFRTGGAIFTALILSFVLGPVVIRWLKRNQAQGQPIREDGPESHLATKKGTPTMGGLFILASIFISTVLWADLRNIYIWATLFIMFAFGILGFIDDYLKVSKKNSRGIIGKLKVAIEIVISAAIMAFIGYVQSSGAASPSLLTFPFFKNFVIDLGVFYVPFAVCVILGATNGVNYTDGLDGLAIFPVMVVAGVFLIISYVTGNAVISSYLQIMPVPGSGELAVFCGAMIGAGLGFLWYNSQPASVFMGDTGSLALGGAIGMVACITKHEIVLAIAGGLFVIEVLSVALQVASFRLTGKRIFKMAPIHHHFEKLGWPETKVVARFWILSVVFALIALSTLKLR